MDTAQQQPEPGGPSNLAGAPAQDETQAREDDGRYGQAEGPGPIGAGLPDCGLIDEPVPGAEQEEAAQVGECLSKIEVKAQARQARRSTGSRKLGCRRGLTGTVRLECTEAVRSRGIENAALLPRGYPIQDSLVRQCTPLSRLSSQ